jgi:hypothetical protein
MEQHYLFLSSRDSLEAFPGNDVAEFVVQLPEALTLNGLWCCALKEFVISSKEKSTRDFYICSDFSEDSFVGGQRFPVLRRVRRTSSGTYSFTDPFYMKVNRQYLNRLRIHIRGDKLEPINIEGKIMLTIHLKRVA